MQDKVVFLAEYRKNKEEDQKKIQNQYNSSDYDWNNIKLNDLKTCFEIDVFIMFNLMLSILPLILIYTNMKYNLNALPDYLKYLLTNQYYSFIFIMSPVLIYYLTCVCNAVITKLRIIRYDKRQATDKDINTLFRSSKYFEIEDDVKIGKEFIITAHISPNLHSSVIQMIYNIRKLIDDDQLTIYKLSKVWGLMENKFKYTMFPVDKIQIKRM